MLNDFTHLRIYTNYSIKHSIININDLIKKAKEFNYNSIAITDINNLFGSYLFYIECIKNNIKPIIGCDIYIKNKLNIKKPYKLLLLIKNNQGYINLSKLISKASLYNDYFFNLKWFNGGLSKGLIALSSTIDGNIGDCLLKNNYLLAKKYAIYLKKCFFNNFFIEIQRHNKNLNTYNKKAIILSKKLKIPIVATNPTNYIDKEDFLPHKAKCFISKTYNYNSIDNFKNQYFKNKTQIINDFLDIPTSVLNTIKISNKCNFKFKEIKNKFPYFKFSKKFNKININKYFIKFSKIFLKIKIKKNFIEFKKYLIYKKKLLFECMVLITMKLTDYFLIVYDFVKWSKKRGVYKGPGRGSGVSSVVSYCLNITDLDPIKYGLIFERFLNIERKNLPDLDIDFCQNKRELVINYIKYKYGICYTGQIITFGKIAVKNSLKEIGRFLKFNFKFINKISKNLIFVENLLDFIKNNEELFYLYNSNLIFKKLIDLTYKIEGLVKSIGIHSGGVIVSSIKIYNFIPLLETNKTIIIQCYKNDIELNGFLKFDFLGLTTLTIIDICKKNILKKYNKKYINFYINDDKICNTNLLKLNTNNIFQLESLGIKKALLKLLPNNFNDVISLISIYRPGPLNLLNNFCNIKNNNKKISYIDNRLKKILKDTYGFILFQEQIIQIAKIIAGYSLTKADLLRNYISKKNILEIKNQRDIFIKNALLNKNIKINLSNKIFDFLEEFSGYSFNKSHAVAYSFLSYNTLFIKTYYLIDFLNINMNFFYFEIFKLKNIIFESINYNIYILPININHSFYKFIHIDKKIKKIRYGFLGIKGLGYNACKNIILSRKNNNVFKKFKSFDDFISKIDKNIVNYKIIEILISSGSFDCINLNRCYLLHYFLYIYGKTNINNYNFYWKYFLKSIEEKKTLGFFIFNNIYNIFKNKILFLNMFNFRFFLYGLILNIQKIIININNKKDYFYSITIINNYKFYKLKLNKFIFFDNFKIIKKYNILLAKIINFNNNYFIVKYLLDFNKFLILIKLNFKKND